MNNEDIRKARKKYDNYLKEKERILKLKSELADLKNSLAVKRYLELINLDDKSVFDEDTIIRYSFSEVHSKEDCENKIYVYMGAYKYDNVYDSRHHKKNKDDEWQNADYLLYVNIDCNYDKVSISPSKKDLFENKYFVLKFNNTLNIYEKYSKLQSFYFKILLNMDLRKKNKLKSLLKERIRIMGSYE